ncbi:MAG: hypothetical protein M3265_01650 [Actinomycetota bacterium]|nr:hypothetical protein [Actinomycetota bacterium]
MLQAIERSRAHREQAHTELAPAPRRTRTGIRDANRGRVLETVERLGGHEATTHEVADEAGVPVQEAGRHLRSLGLTSHVRSAGVGAERKRTRVWSLRVNAPVY